MGTSPKNWVVKMFFFFFHMDSNNKQHGEKGNGQLGWHSPSINRATLAVDFIQNPVNQQLVGNTEKNEAHRGFDPVI